MSSLKGMTSVKSLQAMTSVATQQLSGSTPLSVASLLIMIYALGSWNACFFSLSLYARDQLEFERTGGQ